MKEQREMKNLHSPLVSVIMPAYNAAEFLEEAIASVRAQTVTDWELLVIDDCSTDETRRIVERISAADSRVRLLQNHRNLGAAGSRNRGLDVFRGAYVALLDSDDYWYPTMLKKMLAKAEETGADIIYCAYELVDEVGRKVCNDFRVPDSTSFRESIVRSVITCSTVLITGELARNHRFPTNLYHEDIALWFQILRDGGTARGVDEVLAAYRQRSGSKTANKLKSAWRRWIIYRKHLHLSFFRSLYVTVRYAWYGLQKFRRVRC